MGAPQRHVPAYPALDLWAPVGTDGLPPELLDAVAARDWPRVKALVTRVAPRGVYGRQTGQLRATLPLDVDPVFAQIRGWEAFLSGDWEDLRRCIDAGPVEPLELEVLRDTILAPPDAPPPPPTGSVDLDAIAKTWDYELAQRIAPYRGFARRAMGWRSRHIEERGDVDVPRHLRYRRLQDVALLALTEALGGRLPAAIALSQEAQRLGDEGDVLRAITHDLAALARFAAGEDWHEPLEFVARLATPRGSPPVEACNYLLMLCPLLSIRRDGTLSWAATTAEQIARHIGSPRFELSAQTWRVASGLAGPDRDAAAREVPGLVLRARSAAPGLAAPVRILDGVISRRPDAFAAAARLARRSGQVWAQLAALSWLVSLEPTPRVAARLHDLVLASGWRRLPLVPDEVAAAAAAEMCEQGERSGALLAFAAATGRSSVAAEVALRHIDDTDLDAAARTDAAELLARVGTDEARAALRRVSREAGPVGRAASAFLEHRPPRLGLSERELEVLELAGRGLTNREIAERLSLSPHTVARHITNVRVKLGAANRAEAASRLGELDR